MLARFVVHAEVFIELTRHAAGPEASTPEVTMSALVATGVCDPLQREERRHAVSDEGSVDDIESDYGRPIRTVPADTDTVLSLYVALAHSVGVSISMTVLSSPANGSTVISSPTPSGRHALRNGCAHLD